MCENLNHCIAGVSAGAFRFRFGGYFRSLRFGVRKRVQPRADLGNRRKRQVGHERRRDQRKKNGQAGVTDGFEEPWAKSVLQKRGSDADADIEQRLVVVRELERNVIYAGAAKHDLQRVNQRVFAQRGVIGALRQGLVFEGGVGSSE